MAERIPNGVAKLVVFRAFLASDHVTPATGKTIAITISKNGATSFSNPAAGATNATEMASGFYKFTLGTGDADTNGPLAFRAAEGTIDDVGDVFEVVNANNAGFAGIPNAAPGAANGVFIAGTNAATTITTALTTTFTGNLTGSAASVTGAVGSVTGAVGSVTGAVGSVTAVSSGAITEASYATTAGSFAPLGIVDQGTAQSATSTALVLRSAAAFANDELVGATIVITGGSAGVGQAREITDYVSSTDTATVETWTTTPTGTITYKIFASPPLSASSVASLADGVWDELLSGHAVSGSAGEALSAAGTAGDPWTTALPGAYGSGTAGKIIGDNINATISSRASQTSVDDLPTNAELATALGTADDAVLAILGTPAGASVSADIAAAKVDTAAIKTKTDFLPSATAGAAGGLFIAGANAATSITTALTANVIGNVTGNLTGSVGSVTGAVGSVTGAVGSVTGAVGSVTGAVGSVTGLTASDVGAIKAKTDSLTFTVTGKADANVTHVIADPVVAASAKNTSWGGTA